MIELMIDDGGICIWCCCCWDSGLGLGNIEKLRFRSDGVLRSSVLLLSGVLLSKQICGIEISTWWWWLKWLRFASEGVDESGLDGVSAKWRGDEKSPSSRSSRKMSFSSLEHCAIRRCCCGCGCSASTYPLAKNMVLIDTGDDARGFLDCDAASQNGQFRHFTALKACLLGSNHLIRDLDEREGKLSHAQRK